MTGLHITCSTVMEKGTKYGVSFDICIRLKVIGVYAITLILIKPADGTSNKIWPQMHFNIFIRLKTIGTRSVSLILKSANHIFLGKGTSKKISNKLATN